ncbi:ATP synthase F1 subunit delta [Boudabousia liubingyangii]|uniref:ATP synthase subunit delta n=1 Tax=Boudabousia liubingyangii TaxID=1921764 RepID=A0A1Q5PKT2_9ACTO|nr:F0F1 ATP synthase subunit delta [Boudabousia liubingyangii]OKL47245.1 ATP synthase F1 subunit delta [Boudabousia liubingyangii]
MRNASEKALAAASKALVASLSAEPTEAQRVGEELFDLGQVFMSTGSLRRALNDPSRDANDKAKLLAQLFESKVSPLTLQVVQVLAAARLSEDEDLRTCLDNLGSQALMFGAKSEGHLGTLVSELGAVRSLLKTDRNLRVALSKASVLSDDQRDNLLQKLLGERLNPITFDLVRRVVKRPRSSSLLLDLDRLASLGAHLNEQRLVRVTSAAPLSEAQMDRLQQILQRKYGPVTINVTVDPNMIGGLRLRLATESIDGTLKSDFAALRRRMAG